MIVKRCYDLLVVESSIFHSGKIKNLWNRNQYMLTRIRQQIKLRQKIMSLWFWIKIKVSEKLLSKSLQFLHFLKKWPFRFSLRENRSINTAVMDAVSVQDLCRDCTSLSVDINFKSDFYERILITTNLVKSGQRTRLFPVFPGFSN